MADKYYPNKFDPCRERDQENEKCDKYDSYVNRDESKDISLGGGSSESPQFRLGQHKSVKKNWGSGFDVKNLGIEKNLQKLGVKPLDVNKHCLYSNHKQKIRDALMKKLHILSNDECFTKGSMCSEDVMLKKIQKRYTDIMETQNQAIENIGGNECKLPECMKDFDKDKHIKYLKSKIATLAHLNFSFLHRVCEEITQSCNPRDVIPDNLLDCSGINGDKNTLFFNDPDLAALGREICDNRERNSNSPARRGFAPSLFLPGTLCQGQDGLYVVVCVPQKEEEVTTFNSAGNEVKTNINRKMVWSPCNLMEIAAYETQKNIRQRIRARKRQLLHVAKEMLKLQSRMYTLHPVTMGQRKVRQCAMPLGGNVEHIVDLGLKRMKANAQQKACQEEIRNIQDRLNDESQIMCNKPYRPLSQRKQVRSKSRSKRRSKSRSKRRSKSRSKK